MPAYILVRVHVTDPARYEAYKQLTPAALARYGGRFLVRGGETAVLEGPPEERRIVILEFPSRERALAFYESEEYRAARAVREQAAEAQFVLVDGVPDGAQRPET